MSTAKRHPEGACHYCGSTSEPLTWDHIVPRVLGGTDGYVNLVESCEPCNVEKDGRFPDCDCERCAAAISHYRATRSFVAGPPVQHVVADELDPVVFDRLLALTGSHR